MTIQNDLFVALKNKYLAQLSEAKATLSIYFNKSVGIGQHSQILVEMDKLLDDMSSANGKLQLLTTYFHQFDPTHPPDKKD
tara:strand:- start:42 stop:284 length:243 start_codon:yes stop_codon:yes gene_type:complete